MKFTDLGDKGPKFKTQGVAEGSGGNWYIRVNGKILNDTKFKPMIFSSEDEARSYAMKLADKKRIPLSQIKLTKSWMDAPEQGVAEDSNPEYDDEAGMAQSNLRTMARAVDELIATIKDKDNLPEWAQEKLAKAEMMTSGVRDYLQSQEEQGIDPQVDEASLAQMRDYFNQADNNSVGVDNKYGTPERTKSTTVVPAQIQVLINKMYHVGKITPQEFEILKRFQTKTGVNVGLKIKEAGANPYAIGMSQAMKSTGDEPPLKKSTINKAHAIARAVEKDQ
jgi:hypothetical protein